MIRKKVSEVVNEICRFGATMFIIMTGAFSVGEILAMQIDLWIKVLYAGSYFLAIIYFNWLIINYPKTMDLNKGFMIEIEKNKKPLNFRKNNKGEQK